MLRALSHSLEASPTPPLSRPADLQLTRRNEPGIASSHFFLHPTDFDNSWSPEPVEFIKINGVQVHSQCKIHRDGCNETSWRPLYPCVQDLTPFADALSLKQGWHTEIGVSRSERVSLIMTLCSKTQEMKSWSVSCLSSNFVS